jgi:FkbM family methyltransferase
MRSFKFLFLYLFNKVAFSEILIEKDKIRAVNLKCNTPLGLAGEAIYLPNDEVIFRSVLAKGVWNFRCAAFLSKIINETSSNCIFLDLGANVGLITKEVMALTRNSEVNFIAVEPLPFHIFALQKNLVNKKLQIIEKAFSINGEKVTIQLDLTNLGNSSIYSDIVSDRQSLKEFVECNGVSVSEFEESLNIGQIVLKSDMQGADSFVLSRFSEVFWNRLEGGVIEELAHPHVELSDIEIIISKLSKFDFLSWSPNSLEKTNLEEISSFWMRRDYSERDLYIRK